jgi:phosphate transport system substrate-binding protein
MKKWLIIPFVGLLALGIVLAGCSSTTTATVTDTTTATTTSHATATTTATTTKTSVSTTTATTTVLSGTITEAGSTTVQPLAEKMAAAFRLQNPDVEIVIQGGGTAVGITSANDGTVDIGAASRELKESDPALVKYILARDGIGIIASPQNTAITGLTTAQIKDIFSGAITDWSEVGSNAGSIHVVAREEGSGTRTAFEELVMGKDGPAIVKTAILQSSNGALKQVVAGDKLAIGFVSLGYVDDTVKALAVNDVAATQDNAKNGTYPIIRPLYFVTKEPATGLVKAFIDFCQSAAGQQIAVAEGYVPGK